LNYLNKKLIRKLLGVKSTILKTILFQYCSKTIEICIFSHNNMLFMILLCEN